MANPCYPSSLGSLMSTIPSTSYNMSQNFLRTHLTHRPPRPRYITAKSWHRITWLASLEFTPFNIAHPCCSFGSVVSTLTITSCISTSHKIQKFSENTSDAQVTCAGVHGSKILAKNHLGGVTRWEAAAQKVKWDAWNTTFSRWYLNPPPSPGATSLSPRKARERHLQVKLICWFCAQSVWLGPSSTCWPLVSIIREWNWHDFVHTVFGWEPPQHVGCSWASSVSETDMLILCTVCVWLGAP